MNPDVVLIVCTVRGHYRAIMNRYDRGVYAVRATFALIFDLLQSQVHRQESPGGLKLDAHFGVENVIVRRGDKTHLSPVMCNQILFEAKLINTA